jgi:hypothetical protein
MAMAARKIVAEPLTITGSIGVITGKFNLAELYRRAGYAKTSISKGRRAVETAERPTTCTSLCSRWQRDSVQGSDVTLNLLRALT